MQAANDAQGHRAVEAIGISEGNGPITRHQGSGITQPCRLQTLGVGRQSHHRQVGDRITAHHLAV